MDGKKAKAAVAVADAAEAKSADKAKTQADVGSSNEDDCQEDCGAQARKAQGSEEECAAITLGANGWQTFWRVTLPNIKWGLLYGVILCNARAMGEFGAVSVVSGHIRGETNTMPLHVEILYNEYDFVGAFAVASLLALLALVTLVAKTVLEWRFGLHAGARH
jgi:ABC-type sulfate transport system permease subunit